MRDETHDPTRKSWVGSANGHRDFPIQNLPLGIFSTIGAEARGGIAIGDMILDLAALAASGLLTGEAQKAASAAAGPALNPMLALGSAPRSALRRRISALLTSSAPERAQVETMLVSMADATMHLPAHIGDYTDFYVGIHHATNIGSLFRPDNPLLPNYKHVPIGYHGRASSIRPSGTAVTRPLGQTKMPDDDVPSFGPVRKLDYELELGVWLAKGNELGTTIPIGGAHEYIAGLTLLNDWSARDIQAWEYQPLGPFLAKNFLTTVSPWIVTLEALTPFRRAQPPRPSGDPLPLPYLSDADDQREGAFELDLDVFITTAAMRDQGLPPHRLSHGPASNMYWTIAQMVTHHASNGCPMATGDLLGTGTISGPVYGSQGSLMEITCNGKEPVILPTGETRWFLEDGDEVTLSGRFHAGDAVSIGFGECKGRIVPARA